MKTFTLFAGLLLVAGTLTAQTWNRIATSFSDDLTNVHFANENLGYVIGSGAAMYKTTDGGDSWSALSPPVASDVSLRGLWGNGAGIVYVSGSANTINGENATLLKSEDFGETWTAQDIGHTNGFENHIFCVDADNCFLSGGQTGAGGMIAHTTTGGPTWAKDNFFGVAFFSQITFADANTGYAVGLESQTFTYGAVYRTDDGGANWSPTATMVPGYTQSIHCWTPNSCICGTSTAMYRTNDSGDNWSLISLPAQETVLEIEFIDVNNGWYITVNGVYVTDDAGATWAADPNFTGTETMGSMHSLSHLGRAYAVGDGGAVYETTFAANAIAEVENIEISVQPNPASNVLNVKTDTELISGQIIDLSGRVVANLPSMRGNSQQTINIEQLPVGIYVLQLTTEHSTSNRRFVKQ